MSETPEEVLAGHGVTGLAHNWRVLCACQPEEERPVWRTRAEQAAHEAQALRDAGHLVTPQPACGCLACNPRATWMVVCNRCGDKRCPRAASHESNCQMWRG